jgi:hypothetical protein
MIPSILVSYAIEQRKKAQKKLEFGKIAGISVERLQEIEARKKHLDNIIQQFRTERETVN